MNRPFLKLISIVIFILQRECQLMFISQITYHPRYQMLTREFRSQQIMIMLIVNMYVNGYDNCLSYIYDHGFKLLSVIMLARCNSCSPEFLFYSVHLNVSFISLPKRPICCNYLVCCLFLQIIQLQWLFIFLLSNQNLQNNSLIVLGFKLHPGITVKETNDY